MADLQPQRPMDCFTSRAACSSTCPSVVARMPGCTSTQAASAFSTLMAPAAWAAAAHAMAASAAARRGKLFDKRASIGNAAGRVLDLDDHRGLAIAARVGAQQRKNAALHFDAAVAVALGGIVQVKAAARRRASIAGSRVGRLQARAVVAPVGPRLLAVAGRRATRNRLDAPGGLQVAGVA